MICDEGSSLLEQRLSMCVIDPLVLLQARSCGFQICPCLIESQRQSSYFFGQLDGYGLFFRCCLIQSGIRRKPSRSLEQEDRSLHLREGGDFDALGQPLHIPGAGGEQEMSSK